MAKAKNSKGKKLSDLISSPLTEDDLIYSAGERNGKKEYLLNTKPGKKEKYVVNGENVESYTAEYKEGYGVDEKIKSPVIKNLKVIMKGKPGRVDGLSYFLTK